MEANVSRFSLATKFKFRLAIASKDTVILYIKADEIS